MGEPNIGRLLLDVARAHRDAPALWARGETLTYGQLFDRAAALAAALRASGRVRPADRVAFLANRTPTAYVALLAAILAGATYAPLNPRFPLERNRAILARADAAALIVDERNRAVAAELAADGRLLVLAPETPSSALDRPGWLGADDMPPAAWSSEEAFGGDDPLYLLFTSGSTGEPKGVPISHASLDAYVRNICGVVGGVGPGDRIAHLVDLTFDISVHDMFVAWLNGAAVHSIPENASLMATRFVQDQALTGWFSVPSTAGLLKQAGQLEPGAMPSLRFTLFCGEALTGQVAEAWCAAAPNARVFNLYGPTEATVAFTSFLYEPGQSDPPPVVALGEPYPGQEIGLFQPDAPARVDADAAGEICLTGSQVTAGYWRAPELNAKRFFEAEGRRWYRTGDLGRRDAKQGYLFAGRVDHQVKIRGYRVELQEIEFVLRQASGRDVVAVVPWPASADGGATGCVGFIAGPQGDAEALRDACRERLPDYMTPSAIVFLDEMPLNASGKVDYPRLRAHPSLV